MESCTRTHILFHRRSSYPSYAAGVHRALSDHDSDVKIKSENADNEVRRLKDCIADLLSVSAIQAIARGSEPGHIIGALLEVLVGTLRLHLAYTEFKLADTGFPIALARFSQPPK